MISGKTSLVGLLGQPVNHSLSPIIHNSAFKEMGLDWCYLAIPCENDDLELVAKALRVMNCKGLNVTIPHKQKILNVCQKLTSVASEIQAVNTLIPSNHSEWIGANTDVEGFLTPLKDKKLKNKNVVVIGCGGSARAVVMALNMLNFKRITIFGRNKNKLNIFITDMKNLPITLTKETSEINGVYEKSNFAPYIEDASLIINTTPVGMNNKNLREQEIPLGEQIWNNLSQNTILYDLIYTPRPTKWLKLGKKKNCITIDGLEMLIHQGALSLKLWSGLDDIPIEIMKLSAKKHLMNYN